MFEKFTEKAINVISIAQQEAMDNGESKISPRHILLGILQLKSNICSRLLNYAGVNADELREEFETKRNVPISDSSLISFSMESKNVFKKAFEIARKYQSTSIITEHLLLALVWDSKSETVALLNSFDVDIEKLKHTLKRLLEKKNKKEHPEEIASTEERNSDYDDVLSLFKDKDSQSVLERAVSKLTASHYEILGTEQIVQSILEDSESDVVGILNESGINLENYCSKLQEVSSRQAEFEEKQIIFTPNAFKTMILALETAKELGSATVKPEHIILGVLKAKSGIAYNIFKELRVEDNELAHKIIKPIEKQMPETLTILRFAKQEARSMNRKIVGSEFILLGIIDEAVGIGARVLAKLGITIKDARLEVERVLGIGHDYAEKDISFSDRAKKILEMAWEKAKDSNNTKIASENILWAITQAQDSVAMKVLSNLGTDVVEINQGILSELELVCKEEQSD